MLRIGIISKWPESYTSAPSKSVTYPCITSSSKWNLQGCWKMIFLIFRRPTWGFPQWVLGRVAETGPGIRAAERERCHGASRQGFGGSKQHAGASIKSKSRRWEVVVPGVIFGSVFSVDVYPSNYRSFFRYQKSKSSPTKNRAHFFRYLAGTTSGSWVRGVGIPPTR